MIRFGQFGREINDWIFCTLGHVVAPGPWLLRQEPVRNLSWNLSMTATTAQATDFTNSLQQKAHNFNLLGESGSPITEGLSDFFTEPAATNIAIKRSTY
jgi:hypothetical protein